VTFVDPTSGLDALPTVRCQLTRLRPGFRTPTTRTVGSAIVVCFQGSGSTAVPRWSRIDHEAAEPSDLFIFSDAPVIEAMRLARTEVCPVAQDVVAVGR
jgi:gentisate 1,2-dioxygenase